MTDFILICMLAVFDGTLGLLIWRMVVRNPGHGWLATAIAAIAAAIHALAIWP